MDKSIDSMSNEEFSDFLDQFRKDVKPNVDHEQFKEDVFKELKVVMKRKIEPDKNGDEE